MEKPMELKRKRKRKIAVVFVITVFLISAAIVYLQDRQNIAKEGITVGDFVLSSDEGKYNHTVDVNMVGSLYIDNCSKIHIFDQYDKEVKIIARDCDNHKVVMMLDFLPLGESKYSIYYGNIFGGK
jgi:hypothetical protein